MLRRAGEQRGNMRKFQLDQSILETVVRFDVADTAPKRRIGPTAQSPAYGTPHFFFALRRVSLGLVCFFRSHLSSHEPHITASSAQHPSAAGLVVHTSQKVFMFARLEGVCRLSLVDCRRQNVTPFRDEGTKRCKRVYRILTTGGSEVPDASVVLFSVFSLVGSHPRAIRFCV